MAPKTDTILLTINQKKKKKKNSPAHGEAKEPERVDIDASVFWQWSFLSFIHFYSFFRFSQSPETGDRETGKLTHPTTYCI